MSEQRLDSAEWCSHSIEQRRVRVPQPPPVRSGQSERLASWLELAIEQISPAERRTVPGRELNKCLICDATPTNRVAEDVDPAWTGR